MRGRSTGELLVLMFAGTICASVLGAGIALVVLEVVNPEGTVQPLLQLLAALINTLLGVTAGFLVGKGGNGRAREK